MINTTVKYAAGPTAVMAPSLNHVKDATAPDPATVVINYKAPVGNALAQLEQFFVASTSGSSTRPATARA